MPDERNLCEGLDSMSLESKNYVASNADIETLTRAIVEAATTGAEGRSKYLNALVATTKVRLGPPPKRRTSNSAQTSPTERDRQLEKLEAVHKEFYFHVDKAARETLAKLGKVDAIVLNKRTNFARTSFSMLRKWVKMGNDITILVAGRTSKGMLAVASGGQPSARILTKRAGRLVDELKPALIALYTADRKAARSKWEELKEEMDEILSGRRSSRAHRQDDGEDRDTVQ